MVTIQADEYGGGVASGDARPAVPRADGRLGSGRPRTAHYLDRVPGVTLLGTNLISLFGLHRRWRGALVGHLTAFEMSSSVPNARYARGHRRLGGARRRPASSTSTSSPTRSTSRSRCTTSPPASSGPSPPWPTTSCSAPAAPADADALVAAHLLDAWAAGVSSLRTPGRWSPRERRAGRASPSRSARTVRCSSAAPPGSVRSTARRSSTTVGARPLPLRSFPPQAALRRLAPPEPVP